MPCNTGIFILSLDCEGKWGMADHINAYHETHFTSANIQNVYTQILGVLKTYNIPASFAFVTAFTQSVERFDQYKDLFYNTPPSYKAWLAKFYHDMENKQYEGWFCPAPLQMVGEDDRHDIGSHSCFHRAFSETELTLEDAEYDFRASQEMSLHTPNTFIYPRNVVGFMPLLKKYGFIGYRQGNAYKTSAIGRLHNLAAEWNIATPSQTPIAEGIVPAGYFLNWPHGLRQYVPDAVTQLRWKNILKNAVNQRGVAHMWFHPHNFINHPRMVQNFTQVMRMVVECRDRGQLTVMTMRDYLQTV